MNGLVIRGSHSVFTVRIDGEGEERRYLECRIKGKILRGVDSYYNPLAPGDRVLVEAAGQEGRITALMERRTIFARKNQKAQGPGPGRDAQILAVNAGMVLAVTTPASPPFRPRFLDRILIQAEAAGIPALILLNKQDLWGGGEEGEEPLRDIEERLEDFLRCGYPVLRISARTGEGLGELWEKVRGGTAVLAGQSGVGKSSIINALFPQAGARVGALNQKYDRGNHTTVLGELIEIPGGPGDTGETRIIDTPGLRRFVPQGIKAEEVVLYMREFAPLAGSCAYGLSCSHRGEAGCKILEALSSGRIHRDRYDSFLRLSEELKEGWK
ncbi:MAG: ribosome small subunit-dependent GTPase A [Treponema sp.]|jgi:ribosome biogenesis GTPase|nr:ribosome small subunit-dependent GTPase A [Treponema sp.]